jgi:G:T-mismatch repair DNA endonuclease (very short patch repair protein)
MAKLYWSDPTYRKRLSERDTSYANTLEYRQKRRLVSQRLAQDPDYIAKITPNDEVKEKIRQKVLERYRSDPDYRRRVLSSRRPTDIEARLIEIIEKYRLPYRYTGDGSFWVGGKNPDFVNVNSEKIAIDLFGDFWHEPSEVESRKSVFADYGWKLIILWGHEFQQLQDSKIAGVIQNA